jgi:hypothetical protein
LTSTIRSRMSRLASFLRSTAGAIDLASIMVGVLVIGIVGSVIAATTFVVIPWSQDEAAKQGVSSASTAESAARVKDGSFLNFEDLKKNKWIQPSATMNVGINDKGTCYVAVNASATGAVFWGSNKDNVVRKYVATDTSDCLNLGELVDSVRDAEDLPTEAERCRTTADPNATAASTESSLKDAFAAGGPVILTSDITATNLALTNGNNTNLDLAGHHLTATGDAGVYVPVDSTFTVSDSGLDGVLDASSTNAHAAGIGARESRSAGAIVIECGNVNASAYGVSAAGDSAMKSLSAMSARTAMVVAAAEADSVNGAAGIGGTYASTARSIKISGGTINATGASGSLHNGAAGIGSGAEGTFEAIDISGGIVTAVGGYDSWNAATGAGIGAGSGWPRTANGKVTISGGTVTSDVSPLSRASDAAFDIGRSASAMTDVSITGGVVNTVEFPVTTPTTLRVSNEAQLKRATRNYTQFNEISSSVVKLSGDIAITKEDKAALTLADSPKPVTLDLNGHFLDLAGTVGLLVPENADLTITDSKKGGTLNATANSVGASGGAGIGNGPYQRAGMITIAGGTVNATGGGSELRVNDFGGAGIGSGPRGSMTSVTITGGTVNATAGYDAYYQMTAAGIGAGSFAQGGGDRRASGPVTITGGVVNSHISPKTGPHETAFDIGGSGYVDTPVSITGGLVNGAQFPQTNPFILPVSSEADVLQTLRNYTQFQAIKAAVITPTKDITISNATKAGLRLSESSKPVSIDLNGHALNLTGTVGLAVPETADLTIVDGAGGGKLTATATEQAGIGSGQNQRSGPITINSGTVVAIGGGSDTERWTGGAGIGGGGQGTVSSITINGGNVTAVGGFDGSSRMSGAGIGGGSPNEYGGDKRPNGLISITGGTVKASTSPKALSSDTAFDIGRSYYDFPVSITGGLVNGVQFPAAGPVRIAVANEAELRQALRTYSQLDAVASVVLAPSANITIERENATALTLPATSKSVTLDLNGTTMTLAGRVGLRVPEGTNLTVTDTKGGGVLNATGVDTSETGGAGIGESGGSRVGKITIAGGTINARGATGGEYYGAAGIGTGYNGSFEAITITGGTVNAVGGRNDYWRVQAAGIGIGTTPYGTDAPRTASGPYSHTGGTVNATVRER